MSFAAEKPCCTVCDQKKLCHICKTPTLWACSDCRINFSTTVYVCERTECRDQHEKRCSGSVKAALAAAQAAKEEAERQRNNLLAVIHRDGGDHTARVGVEQSLRDAHIIVASISLERDEALDKRDALRADLKTVARALQAWQIRLAFVGHPNEPKDWSGPVELTDAALTRPLVVEVLAESEGK